MNTTAKSVFALIHLCIYMSGIVCGDSLPEDASPPDSPDVHIAVTSSSATVDGVRIESREAVITAKRPGFVHLWHYSVNEALFAPLLPSPDGKSFRRKIKYQLRDSKGAQFFYRIVAEGVEEEQSHKVELWHHRHVSFVEFAKGMRGMEDPTGIVLRGVPMNLVPIQDEALLFAVADGPKMPSATPWILKIWRPTYHGTQLPAELESLSVRLGYMITTSGAASNRTYPPDGQRVGRISQRGGKLVADLRYQYGSHSRFTGEITPEQPFKFGIHSFSGSVSPIYGVLTTEHDAMPFLLRQLRKDLAGRRWEAILIDESSEQGGGDKGEQRR